MAEPGIKNNISKFSSCYGCGVCTGVCPVDIITMGENSQGFYKPHIVNNEKCIQCGLCLNVCAFNHNENGHKLSNESLHYFAGWSKDDSVLKISTSGGIAYEISKWGLEHGYKICGATYNIQTNRVKFKIAENIRELQSFQGSKYIPSNTSPSFSMFEKGGKYIVFGLPCQIDSLRRKIIKFRLSENYILIDFFCHGVPSLKVWDKYYKDITKKTGHLLTLIWRNKVFGWHNSYRISAEGENGDFISPDQTHNIFYRLFLGNWILNSCCYDACKYKQTSSAADIRLGDFWGVKFKNDVKGVSAIITLTELGNNLISSIKDDTHIEEVHKDELLNAQMKRCAKRPIGQRLVFKLAFSRVPWAILYYLVLIPYQYLFLYPSRLLNRIKNVPWI